MPDIDLFSGFGGGAIEAEIVRLEFAAKQYGAEWARAQANITALLSTLAERGGASWLLGQRLR